MARRALHLIHWLNPGGIEKWLLELMRRNDRQRWEMDVCCKGPSEGILADDIRETGAEVHVCTLGYRPMRFVSRLAALLRNGQYDVLHAHVNTHMGLAVAAARRAGIPAVITAHTETMGPATGFSPTPWGQLLRWYTHHNTAYSFRHASRVAPISHAVLRGVYGAEASLDPRVEVFYLGCPDVLPITEHRHIEIRRGLGVPATAPILLQVGSFTHHKHHAASIEIFSRIVQRAPEAHLLLAGDGVLRPEVQQQVKQLGTPNVHFLGIRDDVPELMQISQLLLLTSRKEGLPVVVMEAGASRLPVIASDIPSIREALGIETPSPAGIVHSTSDPDRFAQHAFTLLTDDTLHRRCADAGRQRFEQTFALSATAAQLLTIYETCLHTGAV